jgi:hypothetical protein
MIDYLEDTDGDLLMSGGDFVRGESNQQQQRKILLAEPGEYKQAPAATVGLSRFLNDDSRSALLREIRIKFSGDGMKVENIGFVNGKLNVAADYAS